MGLLRFINSVLGVVSDLKRSFDGALEKVVEPGDELSRMRIQRFYQAESLEHALRAKAERISQQNSPLDIELLSPLEHETMCNLMFDEAL